MKQKARSTNNEKSSLSVDSFMKLHGLSAFVHTAGTILVASYIGKINILTTIVI